MDDVLHEFLDGTTVRRRMPHRAIDSPTTGRRYIPVTEPFMHNGVHFSPEDLTYKFEDEKKVRERNGEVYNQPIPRRLINQRHNEHDRFVFASAAFDENHWNGVRLANVGGFANSSANSEHLYEEPRTESDSPRSTANSEHVYGADLTRAGHGSVHSSADGSEHEQNRTGFEHEQNRTG